MIKSTCESKCFFKCRVQNEGSLRSDCIDLCGHNLNPFTHFPAIPNSEFRIPNKKNHPVGWFFYQITSIENA